jgi:phosphoserine aminotransferase
MSQQVHNFSAGPGILPREVIEQAAATVLDFNQSGLSLLEVSHRGKDFVAVMDEARNVVRRLLKLDDSYEVLFLQGGASLQFAMVPFNLLSTNGFAAYLNTGVWAKKAIQEAKMMGNVQVVASSEDQNFNYIPKQYDIPSDADYFHCTSNNTIYGTQMKAFPECKVPLVCDMSSDIFSKPFDASKFSLIYAGAQKNMGPAGATLVIVKKDILGKSGRKIPSMLDYQIHIEGESMYNTPPVFPVYASMLTLQWVEKNGGLEGAEARNNAKAQLLYNEIDRNGLFKGTAAAEDRSYMNATFVLKNPELEEQFNKLLKEAGISGLKGHRSVGGFRASIYNAMPMESVQVLVNVMQHFEKTLG